MATGVQLQIRLVLHFFLPFLAGLLLAASLTTTTTATTHVLFENKELQVSLTNQHHKHKHSGLSQSECPGACTYRCSKTAYKKPCMFFCQKCCFKCRCVPPGTYAHKEVCACYNNWKTQSGGPKCP